MLDAPEFPQLARTIIRASQAGADVDELLGSCRPSSDQLRTARELASQIRAGHAAGNRQRVTRIVAAIQPDDTDWICDAHIVDALPQRYELMEIRLNSLNAEDGLRPPEWAATNSEPQLIRRIVAYRDRWNITTNSPLGMAHQRDRICLP